MRSAIPLAALLLLAASPACAAEPVANYDNVAIAVRGGGTPTLEQVADAIQRAGRMRRWQFSDAAPGRMVATLRVRDRHEIQVLITYDQSAYSIRYRDSSNMSYRPGEGTIHANYNRWVRELMGSIDASLARIAATGAPVAVSGSALPEPGDTWTYQLKEPQRRDGPTERSYVVTVADVSRGSILDQVVIAGAPSVATRHSRAPQAFSTAAGIFSPYLMVLGRAAPGASLGDIEVSDPACSGAVQCQANGSVAGQETISVPAGRFLATKIVIEQTWRGAAATSGVQAGARVITVWYAPEAKRAVKYQSRLSFGATPPMEPEFDLELASYRVSPGPKRVLAAPRPPQIGDNWTYRITDPKGSQGQRSVFVQVASVTPALIVEHVSVQGGFTQPWRHARGGYLIPQGVSVFSPYLPQFEKMALGEALGYIENTDPGCRGQFVCQAKGKIVGEEVVDVAAGRFPAVKVVVEQTWRAAAGASGDAKELERMNGARTLTIWYSKDLKRAVKYESRLTSGERAPMEANFDLELTSYQLK